MIDIKSEYLDLIKFILNKHVADCEVWAFGSRVNGTPKLYSDLDLVIIGSKKIEKKILYAIENDFEESILPFRVDVLDWFRISENFQKIIKSNFEIIRTKGL